MMYEVGSGIPQDYVQAHMFYNLGEAAGDENAAELRDLLAKKITPSQMSIALILGT
jgi:uncharacterized protein